MLKAFFTRRTLRFAFVAHTSRETFRTKRTYFIDICDSEQVNSGSGEVPIFPSLQPSFVDFESFEAELADVCANINDYAAGRELPLNSAIRFGVESALSVLRNDGTGPFGLEAKWNVIDSDGIPINGLVWMNDAETMARQIDEKLAEGFRCLKLKIGAIDFDRELELVRRVRNDFGPDKLTIRLDANGAFTADNALARLEALAPYSIHSVEQPVPRDSAVMAEVCRYSPIDIALDEDMIERWWTDEQRAEWLAKIAPRYIILKPSLCGGFAAADRWIETAESLGIGWWATSALESSLGLSAIMQWLGTHPEALNRYHGLGTGQIYTNDVWAGIVRRGERIMFVQ